MARPIGSTKLTWEQKNWIFEQFIEGHTFWTIARTLGMDSGSIRFHLERSDFIIGWENSRNRHGDRTIFIKDPGDGLVYEITMKRKTSLIAARIDREDGLPLPPDYKPKTYADYRREADERRKAKGEKNPARFYTNGEEDIITRLEIRKISKRLKGKYGDEWDW